MMAFNHARAYDPRTRTMVTLKPAPHAFVLEEPGVATFVGPAQPDEQVSLCGGGICSARSVFSFLATAACHSAASPQLTGWLCAVWWRREGRST
jgi:hypothetical protein|eukprot:COSAG01_NODE_7269_length_3275_cov_79.494961_2_plen_94_part_00